MRGTVRRAENTENREGSRGKALTARGEAEMQRYNPRRETKWITGKELLLYCQGESRTKTRQKRGTEKKTEKDSERGHEQGKPSIRTK